MLLQNPNVEIKFIYRSVYVGLHVCKGAQDLKTGLLNGIPVFLVLPVPLLQSQPPSSVSTRDTVDLNPLQACCCYYHS